MWQVTLLFGAFGLAAAKDDVQVDRVDRKLTLQTSLVTYEEGYSLRQPAKDFTVCMPRQHAENLVAFQAADGANGEAAPHREATVPGQGAEHACFNIMFQTSVKGVALAYKLAHAQVPDPATMPQSGQQIVRFLGAMQAVSPYAIPDQQLTVQLPSAELFEHSRPARSGSAAVEGLKITYAGMRQAKPFSAEALELRYENSYPFVHFLSVDRTVTVSHWGRVYVEERYKLRNAGTAVVPPFSRWNLTAEAMRGGYAASPHLRVLPFSLPRAAQYIYAKDDLGAMQIVQPPASEGRAAGVSLVPRYPILGGWTSEMVLGYSLPLAATAQRNGRRHAVLFMVPPLIDIVRPLSPRSVQAVVGSEAAGRNRAACVQEFIADVVTTRVMLPEGASRVAAAPSGIDLAEAEGRSFSYLDTFVGRPTKTLVATNVTRLDLAHPVHVTYRFNPLFALLEPALLVGACLLLFLGSVAASRLDWTLAKDARWVKAQAAATSKVDVATSVKAIAGGVQQQLTTILQDDSSTAAGRTKATAASVRLRTALDELAGLSRGLQGSEEQARLRRAVDELVVNGAKVVADVEAAGGGRPKDKGGVDGLDHALIAVAELQR